MVFGFARLCKERLEIPVTFFAVRIMALHAVALDENWNRRGQFRSYSGFRPKR